MENKPLNVLLVVFVAVLVGMSALFSLNAIIQSSMAPYMLKLNDISLSQRMIQDKMMADRNPDKLVGMLADLEEDLEELAGRIEALEKAPRVAAAPEQPQRPQPPQEDYTTKHDIPVAHSYVRGPKDAPVTITVFEDFQCPFCARFHGPIIEVLQAYPKDVNFIVKHFPLGFHPQAKPAAKAAMAAGEQGKFYEMADGLLDNHNQLSAAKIDEVAEKIGLNMKKFKADLEENDAKYEQQIQEDMQLGSKVGVRGTPTFYINGVKTRARAFDQYKAEIDEILKK